MQNQTKLIIFDLDGTLMDAYRAVWESVNYALRKTDFPPESHANIKKNVGWGDKHLLRGLVGEHNVLRVLKIYRRHHAQALQTGVRLMPGARALLAELKKGGYRLAVASNRPRRFSLIALRVLGIRPFFDVVVCGDEVPRGKPAPDMFRRILQRCNISPREAVYVGDMTIDVEAGRRAKIRTVAIPTGSCRRSELAALKPWKLIRSLKELRGFLGRAEGEKKS